MSVIKDQEIIVELKRIAEENAGILRAEDIVEAAKPETSPLHSRFEWDDSEAAKQYRLYQARNMIRVSVEYIGDTKQMSRVFVSLKTDRENVGGGYRAMLAVMSDSSRRMELIQEAMDDLEAFQNKYRMLDELAKLFEAIEETKRTTVLDQAKIAI